MKKFILCFIAIGISVIQGFAQTSYSTTDTPRIPSFEEVMGGSKWIYVTKNKGDMFYIYESPNNKNNEIIQIWIKELLPTAKVKGKTYNNAECKTLISFDCLANKSVIISNTYYDKNGSVILRKLYADEESTWEDIEPETVMETIRKKVCLTFYK